VYDCWDIAYGTTPCPNSMIGWEDPFAPSAIPTLPMVECGGGPPPLLNQVCMEFFSPILTGCSWQ